VPKADPPQQGRMSFNTSPGRESSDARPIDRPADCIEFAYFDGKLDFIPVVTVDLSCWLRSHGSRSACLRCCSLRARSICRFCEERVCRPRGCPVEQTALRTKG
jgi:hypothetical protein